MVFLCIVGVVTDWYGFIGCLVILHVCVTCALIAHASYAAFIYMYVCHAWLYMVFNYSYVECMYSCIVHVLHPSSMIWSHVRDSSMCNMVNHHYDNPMIQFPPEMDENWVRYGLAKLGQISKLPNWQRMLFCAYTTQLLHSTGEVCWNNKDSYFIWFEFVCRNSGQIASRRSWKRSCLGLEYTSKCSRLAPLWEPN